MPTRSFSLFRRWPWLSCPPAGCRSPSQRGTPENLRSDNGPEFTSRRMIGWAEERKLMLVHIQPGRPMQNGHVESFHGRLRDECLDARWFRTLEDVRRTLEDWRQEYNCERPHSGLDYLTLEEFRQRAGGKDGGTAALEKRAVAKRDLRLARV